MRHYHDISLAFAGVCQCAEFVYQFAHTGNVEQDKFRVSLQSLLVTQPEMPLDVFGNSVANLSVGVETALAQLGGKAGKIDAEVSRYWIGILALSRKLNKNSEAKAALVHRLQQLERQLPLFHNDILHEQIVSNIASIYSDLISPMGTKIQVFGRQDLLSRTDIQNKVRASLLAGVRAGILWQQVGGSRWQFFLSRQKLINATKSLYSSR